MGGRKPTHFYSPRQINIGMDIVTEAIDSEELAQIIHTASRDRALRLLERLVFMPRTAEVQRAIGQIKEMMGWELNGEEAWLVHVKGRIFDGSPCHKCSNRVRYRSDRHCVYCHSSRHKILEWGIEGLRTKRNAD
jgi:hypothetical protein